MSVYIIFEYYDNKRGSNLNFKNHKVFVCTNIYHAHLVDLFIDNTWNFYGSYGGDVVSNNDILPYLPDII